MTDESDSTPRRRPPTIDLTATEVETRQGRATPGADASEAPGDDAAKREASRAQGPRNSGPAFQMAHAIGAAVGVIAMLVIFAGLWLGGFFPSRDSSPPAAVQTVALPDKEISARLGKIEATLAASRPEEGLAARVTAAEAATKSLENSLNALNRRIDDIAVAARSATSRADAASATADAAKNAAQGGTQRADLEALAGRIAALERSVKTLSDDVAHRPASADDRAARLMVAAEALRATVERGVPFAGELAAVKALGIDATTLAPLEPFAETGVPSASALARELATLAPELRRAAGVTPSEHTFLGRLEANAQKLVRVSPVDAPAGDSGSAILARIDSDAARGDIAAALGEIAKLPDATRSLADAWVKKAQARDAAITASRRILADALTALSRPASP
jgi:hypothetical protein